MNTKLTPEQIRWMNEKLNRADLSNDIKTKVDSNKNYIRTPDPLCEEIVGEIARASAKIVSRAPEDAYLYEDALKDKTILVVDTVEFIPVLLAFGVNKCNITFVAPYKYKGTSIAGVTGVQVVQESLLTWKTDMKFDVVVGNPPYQDQNRRPLTQKFIKTFFKLAKETSGIVCMVGPVSWVNGTMPQDTDRNVSSSFSFINSHRIHCYNPDVNCHFNVGKDIGYWIAINTPASDNVISVNNNGIVFTINTTGYKYLPYFLNEQNWSIFEKIHRSSKNYWTKFSFAEIDRTSPAVIFPKSQYSSIDNLCIFDGVDTSTLPTSKLVLLHKIPENQINSAKIQFKSALFRFIYNMVGGNSGCSEGFLRKFPRLENIQCEQDIYKYFNLTQDEINYIEATIK